MCLGWIAECACCCGAALCCSCFRGCAKSAGAADKTHSRIGYVMFQVFWIVLVIISMYLIEWINSTLPTWVGNIGCPPDQDSCFGASLLVRMSFALACTHGLIFLILLIRNEGAAKFNEGCWCVKFLICAAFLICWFFVDNSFFQGYMVFASWVSWFFLAFQAMLMLIVAFVINDALISNVNVEGGEAMSCSGIILITLTFIFFGGNITWIIFQFILFGNKGCTYNNTQMIITCVLSFLTYVAVFLRTRKDASIFTSSLVSSYWLYLQWSAMSSNPDTTCNPYTTSVFNTTFLLILGLCFTFISLLVISAATFKDQEEI